MSARSIEEIEAAFREIGIVDGDWGKRSPSAIEHQSSDARQPQVFISIQNTTTPIEGDKNAYLA